MSIDIQHNQAITEIRLDRSEKHNAFDDTMIQALIDALKAAEERAATRVIILSAQGKNFSAGADLNWMQAMVNYSYEENLADALKLAELMQTLYQLKKPTIALAQGKTFGGGVGLLACCDLVIASEDAEFCFSEVKIGLIPAVISPYVIAAIGERASRRYFLTAERINAQQALQLGLVSEIVPNAELPTKGAEFASMLCQNSPQALAACKQLITAIAKSPINATTLQTTAEHIAIIRTSEEGQEGLQAFLEKRRPKW